MMKRLLYILTLALIAISCERRELTYDYDPTVEVSIDIDWSTMDEKPTGVSVYCYNEDGSTPIITQQNSVDQVTVKLPVGVYNVLIFNQIPTDFGTIAFEGMDSFESAEITTVSTTSKWVTTRGDSDLVRDPEELAAATYLNLEVSEEAIVESVAKSKSQTKSASDVYKTISVTPKVVIKTTRVKIRVSGIYNFRSARATLYGMASGYNFASQVSHETMATHLMESWTTTTYESDYREGEIYATFSCFGLPSQTTTSRATDYSDWEGVLDIEILLIDNSTIVTESIPLADKVTTSSDSDAKSDDTTDLDVNVDININSGFGFDSDSTSTDKPITLQDVEPAEGSGGGFSASVDDWGDEEVFDIPI